MNDELNDHVGDKANVLAMTSAAFGGVLLCYLVAVSIAMPGWTTAKAAGLAAALLFLAYAGTVWWTGQYRRIAHVFILTAQLMAFAAALTNGGLTGYVAPFQVVAPLAAGFFLSRSAAIGYGMVSCGLLVLLLVLDINGLVTATAYSHEAERVAALFLLVTTTLLGLICVTGFVRSLERMLVVARKAERAKSVFLANMSHEIRTPMNGVLGLLDLARRGEAGVLDRRGVETAHASATALVTVLNDILDVSQLDQGAIRIEPKACDLRALCEEVTGLFAAELTGRDVVLELDYSDRLADWQAVDAVRVRQVLSNLVGNAVKFTERGHVRLVLEPAVAEGGNGNGDGNNGESRGAGGITVAVEDTGIGLSAAARARVFDRFAQADDTITRDFGGAGLGLTICRELTALMGDALTVDSEPGRGSTFRFRLDAKPLDRPVATAPHGAADEDGALRASLDVLVVDDQAVNRTVTRALLTHLGHNSVLAESGEAALELAAEHRFDVILMDIQMPGLDGLDVTRSLRRGDGINATTPIHALTASALDGDRVIYREAGMDGCLGKPLQVDELANVLACCERSRETAAVSMRGDG